MGTLVFKQIQLETLPEGVALPLRRPTDWSILVRLVARVYATGGNLHRLDLPDMNQIGLLKQQEVLRRPSQQIHFLDGNADLTSGPKFVTLHPRKSTLSASDSGPTPFEGQKRFVLLQ